MNTKVQNSSAIIRKGAQKMSEKRKKSFFSPTPSGFHICRTTVEQAESMPSCHYHNDFEFYYLVKGKRYYFIKDKVYLITPGTIVFINKFIIHYTECFENEGYDRILINFSEDYIEKLLTALGSESVFSLFDDEEGVITLSSERRELCESILSVMTSEYEKNGDIQSPYLKSSLLELIMLMRLEKDRAPAPTAHTDIPHKTISEIIGYINNNYLENITLDTISQRFYISRSYFSRTFKQIWGLGFTEYLNNVRIKEAKKLLSNSKMSIAEISCATGYKSSTHFGRVFQKIVGTTPMEYRKLNKSHS